MRKRIISQDPLSASPDDDQGWLDLESLVLVELTSEDADYPIEAALKTNVESGWCAQQPGIQTIRLLFDKPRQIRRIQLMFQEYVFQRTQEFVLRWSSGGEEPYRKIVRQQYNFNPPSVTCEIEDYVVDLLGLAVLELSIIPDINGGEARASLAQLRLA